MACLSGQRPQQFNSRVELPSNVIWISDAYSSSNAQNFRASNFMRATPRHIAEDLGVDLRDPIAGMPAVADVLGRVRDIAAHAYPWIDMAVDWSERAMGAAINKLLDGGWSPDADGDRTGMFAKILHQAYQGYSAVPDTQNQFASDSGGGRHVLTLRSNRLRYADWLLKQRFPSVPTWVQLTSPDISLDKLLDPQTPCLVEASIEFLKRNNDVPASLIAFGSSNLSSSRQTIRTWISQPELAWLVEYANVHVNSVLTCPQSDCLSPHLQLPRILTADPIYALSLSAGVLAEAHWSGISQEQSVRRQGASGTTRFMPEPKVHAVWIRAYDRAYSFQMALAAFRKGFQVTSYGYGSVSFWAPKDRIDLVAELASEIGACHPNLAAMRDRLMIDSAD